MLAIRRIYIYVVAGISLAMFLVGLAYGGGALLELAISSGALEATFRGTIAAAGAGVLIGLPVWVLHWRTAQRLAARDAGERASALRRLYFYLVNLFLWVALGVLGTALVLNTLGAATNLGGRVEGVAVLRTFWHLALVLGFWVYHLRIDGQERATVGELGAAAPLRRLYLYGTAALLLSGVALVGIGLIHHLVAPAVDNQARLDPVGILLSAWALLLLLTYWAYHMYIARLNRASVGERGDAATIRRLYAYSVQFAALTTLLFGAQELLRLAAYNLLAGSLLARDSTVPAAAAVTLVGLSVWFPHLLWTARGEVGENDRHSTLRALEGFTIVALAVAITLVSASAALHETLARLFGASRPGDLPSALVQPISSILVFGAAWALVRRWLARDATAAELARQAGVRRLYTHLVALLSLGAVATGVAGLLWTLAEQTLGAGIVVRPDAWRDGVSLSVAMVVVGLPVWLAHWRPEPAPDERRTLSRRMYMFGSLLASALALLGTSASLVFALLSWALAPGGPPVLDIGRALSVAVVAAGVAAYHWRVLRRDNALRAEPTDAAVEAEAGTATVSTFRVEIAGATEDEIMRTLAGLPAHATYSVRPIEPAAAG